MAVGALPTGLIKLNSLLYSVAKDSGGKLRYSHVSGPVERGLGLWEWVAFKGGRSGAGYASEKEGGPDEGFFYSKNCLSVLPDAISLPPSVGSLSPASVSVTNPVREFFEQGGFLYAVHTALNIVKIDPATPSISDTFDVIDGFQVGDFFGQPVFARGPAGTRWFIPTGGATSERIAELRTQGSPDIWMHHVTLLKGAGHFIAAATNIWRSVAETQGRAISACDINNDITIDANWGADFPIGTEEAEITALVSLHRFLFVVNQANMYAATEDFNADAAGGAVSFSEMLPDLKFSDERFNTLPLNGYGSKVWGGSIIIPSGHSLYRHDITTYDDISIDAFPDNDASVSNLTDLLRGGTYRSPAIAGSFMFIPYQMPDVDGYYIMAARRRKRGEVGNEAVIWQPIFYSPTGKSYVCYVQENGSGAPRLWWGDGSGGRDYKFISLAKDGSPYKIGGSFGAISSNGEFYGSETDLGEPGTPKLMREVEYIIDEAATGLTWAAQAQRDGGAPVAVGAAISGSGSTTRFFAANTTARRMRSIARWDTDGTFVPAGNKTRVRRIIFRGSYLPNVSDRVQTVIDIKSTAMKRGVSPQKVRKEIEDLVLSGGYSFVDLHGAPAVSVVVDEAQFFEGGSVAGLEGKELAQLSLTVVELA